MVNRITPQTGLSILRNLKSEELKETFHNQSWRQQRERKTLPKT